jgi:tyrosyl-tRNA synthetase
MFHKKTINTDSKAIEEVLTRGVDSVYPSDDWLRAELKSGRRLRLYTGWDPTTTDVHIGHTAWMWKLRAFQDLGHEVVVLLGTFTGMIGDPTGKASARTPLNESEVRSNSKGFEKKVARIFDNKENPITVKMNHQWLGKMTFADVVDLASHMTVQQMLERDMFVDRMKDGKPIGLHEFLYPLMQGYDSVAMDVDLEVGGTDQTFNMLAGRTLLKKLKNKNKGVLTLHLIADASGRKIGKSEGNAINIDLPTEELYGKIMTLPDEIIWRCFEMCTPLSMSEIEHIKASLEDDPRAAKARLAFEIVRIYNDDESAKAAELHFESVFSRKEAPEKMDSFKLKADTTWVAVLVSSGLCSSNSDARRQIRQGAVKLDGRVIGDESGVAREGVLQKGKRHFRKLI